MEWRKLPVDILFFLFIFFDDLLSVLKLLPFQGVLPVLFHYYLSFSEDVEARMETTVGGGAWLNIEDAVELTG